MHALTHSASEKKINYTVTNANELMMMSIATIERNSLAQLTHAQYFIKPFFLRLLNHSVIVYFAFFSLNIITNEN